MKKSNLAKCTVVFLAISTFLLIGCQERDERTTNETSSETYKMEKANQEKTSESETETEKREQDEDNLIEKVDNIADCRTVKVYYVDEQTGDVTGKNVEVTDENDIWTALQDTGLITEDCRLLNFAVNEKTKTIDLDFNSATGERIRGMGTTGETQIIGCIVNTYLEAYNCDGIRLTENGASLEISHGSNMDGYSGMMSF